MLKEEFVMWYRRSIFSSLSTSLKFPNISLVRNKSSANVAVLSPIRNEIQAPRIQAVSLKESLSSFDCKYEEGHVCFQTHCGCPNEKKGVVYINKVTGFFVCVDCQKIGERSQLDMLLKKSKSSKPGSTSMSMNDVKIIQDYSKNWNELAKSCKSVSSFSPEETDNIITLFKLQTADRNVLGNLDTIYDETRKVLYLPLSNGHKRIVGIMELAQNGTETCVPFKQCPGIFRYVPSRVTVKKCENVILVASVKDLIALSYRKHNYHVICSPHGSSALPQEILPLFEQYTRIVLWFGGDQLCLNAARAFAQKLCRSRCYFIKEIEEPPSGYIEKNGSVDIPKILSSARSAIHKYITTFAELKHEVFSALTNADTAQGIQWQRFPVLNEILRGHRRGELTILTGPTGTGKTTFLSEYSLDLAMQGVTTLWGSFEIRNQRLAHTMLQQFALVPLGENLHQFDAFVHEFEKVPMYFLKFHGQESIDVVMEAVEHATYVYDIQHLVIDNLQFMLGLSSSEERFIDRFYKQDKVIAAFRTFATRFDCHVTLIIHPKKEKETEDLTISSIFGGAKASQESDNIMIIQKKLLESLHFKKYLQIVKNRYSGDLGIMPLQFVKPLLSFGAKNLNKPS